MKMKNLALDLLLICSAVAALLAAYPLMNGHVMAQDEWQPVHSLVGPLVVKVSVTVSNAGGGVLSYQWRATDGSIVQANSPTTTWTLPHGPGLHFAYVLVSNGKGGYTERRVAVNTDAIGGAVVIPSPVTVAAPAEVAASGNFYRGFIVEGEVNTITHLVLKPDLPVFVVDQGTGKHYPSKGVVYTDLRGSFTIPGVPAISLFSTQCSPDGGATFGDCSSNGPVTLNIPAGVAVSDYVYGLSPATATISGHLNLQDGSPCGTLNEFFGVDSTATATLFDAFDIQRAPTVRVNEAGDYSLPYNSQASYVLLQCEGAAPLKVAVTGLNATGNTNLGVAKLPGVLSPVVSTMTAMLGTTSVGGFLPPPTGLPSDIVTRADTFLAEKGLDTRIGACQYYKMIGVVTGCDASGNFTGSISYDQWQRQLKIGKYVSGTAQYSATYVNKVDLNLTRQQLSVSYSSTDTAAVVCNHLGPATDSQADINTAIANAVAGKNLVACVAMDYMVHTGVNGNQPFVRFMIFGPSGQLLPSVNLDGRREKFVPGTCVVCHGGDHYAGKFPETGLAANVGGHFLPYDAGNFEFSTTAGLTEANQEQQIYLLNRNILKAGPTSAEKDLIAGWYGSGQVLNKSYVPTSWAGQGTAATNFYKNVYARSCRTCHVAMVEGYNFDHYANITPGGSFYRGEDASTDVGVTVCGGQQINRAHTMPNSLVTFNRFWESAGTSVDQPSQLTQFLGSSVSPTGVCTKGLQP